MIFPQNGKVTLAHVLFPVSLLAFALFLFFAFQTSQILRERDALTNAYDKQAEPVAQAEKVKSQLDALAVGTLKLSEKGNKSAKAIIDRMKKLGITVTPPDQAKAADLPVDTKPALAVEPPKE